MNIQVLYQKKILKHNKNKKNYLKYLIIKKFTEQMKNSKILLINQLNKQNLNLYNKNNNNNKLLNNPRLYHYKNKLNKLKNYYEKIN